MSEKEVKEFDCRLFAVERGCILYKEKNLVGRQDYPLLLQKLWLHRALQRNGEKEGIAARNVEES